MKKSIVSLLLSVTALLALVSGAAGTEEGPREARLSANRMRFDSRSGDFLATGNVVIQVDGLTILSPRGTGNVERKEVLFEEGVTASGDWRGDPIALNAGTVELFFGDVPSCRMTGGVKGRLGTMRLDAERMMLKGRGGLSTAGENESPQDDRTRIWLAGVRRLEDGARGVAFGAGNIEGLMQGGVLVSMNATTKVWLEGRPSASGEPVTLRGDAALYSTDRGSVVMTGNVRALQKGRVLTSDSIVYFPDQNRVEAMGGVARKDGVASADRATITIDLSQEPRKSVPGKQDKK